MKKRIIAAAVAAVALTPMAASADDVSWDLVELGWVTVSPDVTVGGGSVDGFGIGGSFGVSDYLHVVASWADVEDSTSYALGVGYHTEGDTSLFAELSYINVDAGSFSDDGYGLDFGARSRSANFEFDFGISFVDFSSSDVDTSFFAGGAYYVNDNFAIGFDVAFSEDASGYGVFARYDFSR